MEGRTSGPTLHPVDETLAPRLGLVPRKFVASRFFATHHTPNVSSPTKRGEDTLQLSLRDGGGSQTKNQRRPSSPLSPAPLRGRAHTERSDDSETCRTVERFQPRQGYQPRQHLPGCDLTGPHTDLLEHRHGRQTRPTIQMPVEEPDQIAVHNLRRTIR